MQTAGEDAETADLRDVLESEQLGVLETINKHGFTEGEMRALHEGAGLGGTLSTRLLSSR